MTKYSSKDVTVNIGGEAMQAHILDDVTLSVEAITEESTAFGDDWQKHISTGIKRADPITVGGFYDIVALGPDAILNDVGAELAVIITWGGGKTSTVTCIVQKYERLAKVNEMQKYVATLLPTGEVQEA